MPDETDCPFMVRRHRTSLLNMDGQDYLRITTDAFVPFLSELGFRMDAPSISGRFYRVSFTALRHQVSLSYEPGDDAFFVVVFCREGGQLSDYDDRTRTPRLSDLNMRYMHLVSVSERASNQAFFEGVIARDPGEGLVLKAAKELRLVLPRHLQS